MAQIEPLESPPGQHAARRLAVFDPATLERLGEIEVASEAEVGEAVERARKAFADWREQSFEQRGRLLLKVRDLIVERSDALVDTITRDTGKPRFEAMATEVLASCDALGFYARNAGRLLRVERKRVHLLRTKKLLVAYRPMGVVGLITPWNFPFLLMLNPIAQALMAGNTVIAKPSEVTPFVGQAIGELFRDAGAPEGVLQVLTGDGSTGAALVEAGCDKISFTGSVRTGRRIAEACGRKLIPCTLELGGKDPMIVCDDANLERAARGAVYGAFANSGQICMSTERVYVTDKLARPFVDRVVELTEELRQGPESEGEIDVGAISSPRQLDVIEGQLADAVAKGARVRTGGRRNPAYAGFFFEPTVLTDVTPEMTIMREETFGPVLPIQVVASEDEAVRLANESDYGLSASIWTRDRRRGQNLASRLESGSVVVDDCMVGYGISESPFGGVKDSGIGRVNGEHGLRSYCHVQSVVVDRFGTRSEPLWYPYSERKYRLFQRALRLLYRTPLGRLMGG